MPPRLELNPAALASRAILQSIILPELSRAAVELAVLRLDRLDPLLSGNKWFKLSGFLQALQQDPAWQGLISVGGPHSNHLHALAAAGARFGIPTVGLLRGVEQDTPTVRDLQQFGMQLYWLGYGEFRQRYSEAFAQTWLARYPDYRFIPEGGSGLPGVQACQAIAGLVEPQLSTLGWSDFDGWWLACGTGSTLAGLVLAEQARARQGLQARPVYGALAGPLRHGVAERVAGYLQEVGAGSDGYRLLEAARRGFGQTDPELQAFMQQVEAQLDLPLEPVYTAKALLALSRHPEPDSLPRRLVFVHTGGLQGRRASSV